MQQHFYQDVREAQASVFKCPECPLLFPQKPELMQHVQVRCSGKRLGGHLLWAEGLTVHLSLRPVSNRSPHPQSTHGVPRNVDELSSLQSSADASSGRSSSRAPTESPAASVAARGNSLAPGRWGKPDSHRRVDARPRLRSTGWTCQECQEWVPDRESYISHMKKSHDRVSVAAWVHREASRCFGQAGSLAGGRYPGPSSSSDMSFLPLSQTMKRYPCRQCEQSFHTPNSLRKHIRNSHDTVKKVYMCG